MNRFNFFKTRKAICLIGLIIMSSSISFAQEVPLKITLDQALEIALSESNTIKIADLTIEKSQYADKGAYASLYPNVSANGSFQRTLKKQKMVMEMNGQAMEIEVGTDNNVNAGINASMPLVNAQLWESLKLSKLDIELAIEQARSSKVSMIAQVRKAYYGILLAQEALNVYTQVYDNAQKNYDETLKKFNVGKASEFDMLRSQVTMMNAEPNVSSAESSLILSKWQLNALMGIDLETKLETVGSLADYTGDLMTPYDNNYFINNNSTLQQLNIQGKQVDASIRMTKFQYIPTLSAAFGYNYVAMGNSLDMNWNPYSTASLSLNIPIFDGFSKRNTIRQTKKTKDILDLQIEDTKRNIDISIKNYTDQIALSIKNFSAAKSTVEVAQKSYTISEKMYETGKATLVELNDAQLALTQAQLTMNQAIYNYMAAKASLDEILGNENK